MAHRIFLQILKKLHVHVDLSTEIAQIRTLNTKMFPQFFSIGVIGLAVVATLWSTFVYTSYSDGEKYYVFALRNQTYAISELKLFSIVFTITYCGTFGIRRFFYKRSIRRRESSE